MGRFYTCPNFVSRKVAKEQRRKGSERLVYDLSKVIIFVIVGCSYECFNCQFKISDRYD